MSKLQEHAIKYIKILDSLLKEDLDSHDMLFACEDCDNTPMEFCMKPSKDEQSGEIMKKLAILVDKCGGSMKFNNFYAERTNSIKLVNKGESLLDANEDYFYSDYLIDCLQEKKLKDLNNYRANKSKYSSSLNVMDILNRRKMWNQADRTKVSDEEISDFDHKESSNSKYSTKKMFKKSKSTYSIEEDLKILQYIVNHKTFYRLKSRSLWQEMEKKNVCNGRTWQSLKERMKYIIPKIKTYHLSEQNQSAIVEGFMNPNSNDGVRYLVYSSTESENEDVLSTNQYNDKSVTNSILGEQNVECSPVTDQNTTLLCDKQMAPSKCGDIPNDIVDHQNTHLLTSTDNVIDSSCNSFKLMTIPIMPVSDVTFTLPISSTISECLTSDISRCGNTISESKKDVQKNGVNISTNSTNPIDCTYKDNESTKEENCDKEKMVGTILNEKILTTNESSENDVETSYNYDSGKENEESFIDETDIEDDENFESMLPGINNFPSYNEGNINSLKTATNDNNIIADRSHLVEVANQSMIIEDKNSDDAENNDNLKCDLECQQSLNEVEHNSILFENQVEKLFDDDKLLSISMETSDVNNSTHESDYIENSSGCDSNKTALFNADKASFYISLNKTKEETLIREYLKSSKASCNRPVDLDCKRVASKHSEDKSKYKITFHKKHGCKRVLISNSKCQSEESNFSISEDIKIIKYIYKYNAINRISGIEMWISMVERDFENKRTWGSLKERFMKRIFPNIKYYQNEGVSEKLVDFFFEEYKKKNPQATSVKENDTSKADHEFPSDRAYTIAEKQAIVNFIIETRRFNYIKGNTLYKTMEIKMPNKKKRSWQSLKSAFKYHIMPNIEDFVKSKDDCLAFKSAWKKLRTKRKFKRSPAICSESSDDVTSDCESNVNAVATPHIPQISNIQQAGTGDGHIKQIKVSISSDDSDNVNNNSSSKDNIVDDFKSKNIQNYSDNINVKKKKKLFTETDELFRMTPCNSSLKQNIPQKEALSEKESVQLESTSPFNVTILKQTDSVEKINSSCEMQIPNIGNEIILSHTPCKKHLKDQSNRTRSSCKKRIEELENNSPSSSASKRKFSASPGRQNEEDQMLDAVKPKFNLRSKPKPDTALRKDLRVRKVHTSKKY